MNIRSKINYLIYLTCTFLLYSQSHGIIMGSNVSTKGAIELASKLQAHHSIGRAYFQGLPTTFLSKLPAHFIASNKAIVLVPRGTIIEHIAYTSDDQATTQVAKVTHASVIKEISDVFGSSLQILSCTLDRPFESVRPLDIRAFNSEEKKTLHVLTYSKNTSDKDNAGEQNFDLKAIQVEGTEFRNNPFVRALFNGNESEEEVREDLFFKAYNAENGDDFLLELLDRGCALVRVVEDRMELVGIGLGSHGDNESVFIDLSDLANPVPGEGDEKEKEERDPSKLVNLFDKVPDFQWGSEVRISAEGVWEIKSPDGNIEYRCGPIISNPMFRPKTIAFTILNVDLYPDSFTIVASNKKTYMMLPHGVLAIKTLRDTDNYTVRLYQNGWVDSSTKNAALMRWYEPKRNIMRDSKQVGKGVNGRDETLFPDGRLEEQLQGEKVRTSNPRQVKGVRKLSDGSLAIKYMSGILQTNYPDGKYETRKPDGETFIKYPDGKFIRRYPDGNVHKGYPDGTHEMKSPKGKVKIIYPDESMKIISANGKVKILRLNDKCQSITPEGEISTLYPDGGRREVYPDGSIGIIVPNGRATLKHPDRSFTVHANHIKELSYDFGLKTTIYPNGIVKMEGGRLERPLITLVENLREPICSTVFHGEGPFREVIDSCNRLRRPLENGIVEVYDPSGLVNISQDKKKPIHTNLYQLLISPTNPSSVYQNFDSIVHNHREIGVKDVIYENGLRVISLPNNMVVTLLDNNIPLVTIIKHTPHINSDINESSFSYPLNEFIKLVVNTKLRNLTIEYSSGTHEIYKEDGLVELRDTRSYLKSVI